MIALGITAVLCIAVLFPRHEWTFTVNVRKLITEHLEVPQRNDAVKLMRFLADHFQGYYNTNSTRIELAYGRFWWACVSLDVAIGMWILELVID